MIFNMVGGGGGKGFGLPQFTYTGTYTLLDDGNDNWRIKFTSSGTLRFSNLGTGDGLIDIFCVGGGGSGGYAGNGSCCGAGGGGYTNLGNGVISKNTDYVVTIGGSEEASSFGSLLTANAGGNGTTGSGGNGGSGGSYQYQVGGSDGGDGRGGNGGIAGMGMGTYAATGIYYVREFREASGQLYSGGGGGGGNANNTGGFAGGAGGGGHGGSSSALSGTAGATNTGGGGGGKYAHGAQSGSAGGSGIVIIRNHRSTT